MEKYSFENFIMQCCQAKEWELRSFLKRILKKANFKIIEDNYETPRASDRRYKTVHNMLAIRGNPRTCLVAHTDVCRDHSYGSPNVDPVIKTQILKGEARRIIQDRNCNVQVGGDDRLGVAINTWIAINTGFDVSLLFTTDEEVGLLSAECVKFSELMDYELLLQVDRGNHSNQLVVSIGGCDLCTAQTANRLIKISEEIKLPRYKVGGMMTDVLAIKQNGICKNAVNMTCGYHNSFGAEKDEFIDIQEAKDTMKFVSNVVKYYYLEEDKNEPIEEIIEEPDEEEENEYYTMGDFINSRANQNNRRSKINQGLYSQDNNQRSKDYAYYDDEKDNDDEYTPLRYRGKWV